MNVTLSNGGIALVDEADAARIAGRSWFGVRRGRERYAASYIDGKQVLLHRHLLSGSCEGLVVDHINFDGLDNRRENLRCVSRLENGRRKRKPLSSIGSFKGVTRARRKWMARIRVGARCFYLGSFDEPRKAAVAYNRVARRVFGPMALLNEIPK
jgi:hypothetical protein